MENWIDGIEDVQARTVFRMYYIDGATWTKISNQLGYANSPDYPRLHIRDAYLKKVGIKIKKRSEKSENSFYNIVEAKG